MKKFFRAAAASAALIIMTSSFSCGEDVEEINDSQESATDENAENNKTVLTIGMPGINNLLEPLIKDFNKKSKDCEIKIVDYAELTDDSFDGGKAVHQMNLDLAAGKAADIICCHPEFMAEFIQKDVFVDMYELMESHDGIKKEDFIPNVIKGFEVNGKIPAISNGFYIRTAIAKTKNVGEGMENWTPQQAIEAYRSMPENMEFLYDSGDGNRNANFFMTKAARSCIDMKNYSCSFNNQEFINILDFLPQLSYQKHNYSIEMTEEEIEIYFKELNMSYINDKSLISEININGLNHQLGYNIFADFGGENITFVGYPSEDGNGYITGADHMYGISKSCQNTDAAWEFISYLLSEEVLMEYNLENACIPVIQDILDKAYTESGSNADGYMRTDYLFPDGRDNMKIPEEMIQYAYEYITNVQFEPYFSYEAESIVREEYAAVIAGEKSGKECADIIQSRISIFMNEKK